MKNIEYDSSRPLMRLERGDKAIIMVNRLYGKKDKYKDIPNGAYEAVCIDDHVLECKEYPVLSGSYNFWHGDKRGCSYIHADEYNKRKITNNNTMKYPSMSYNDSIQILEDFVENNIADNNIYLSSNIVEAIVKAIETMKRIKL